MTKFLYAYTILLTCLGVFIHAFGLLGLEYGSSPSWLHLVMLSIDSTVVIGLMVRSLWGWWLGVILFIQQVICQTYWLYQSGGLDAPWIQIPVPLLCLAALVILLLNKCTFVQLRA